MGISKEGNSKHLKEETMHIHFSDACCSWTSNTDELLLEQSLSTTVCSKTVCHVIALIVLIVFQYIYILD